MKAYLVSACLLGIPCKYSGGDNLCPAVLELRDKIVMIPVCPEQLGGLPTPRPAAERQGDSVVNQVGRDVTEEFRTGAQAALALARLFDCCGAILKSRSPSCGVGTVYDGSFSGTLVPGNGVTAQLLEEAGLALYTEENLPSL